MNRFIGGQPQARAAGTEGTAAAELTPFLDLQHGWQLLADTIEHVVTPALHVIDWVLFVPKGTPRPIVNKLYGVMIKTIEDPETFSKPWTISMHLYRNTEPNAELLEFKCVEFSENLLYNEFLKEPLP